MIRAAGRFTWSYYPPGSRRPTRRARFTNGVTTDGLNYLLNAGFLGRGQKGFYVGLIAGGGFTELSPTDTAPGHPGWVEFTQYYTVRGSDYLFGRQVWETTPPQGGRLDSRFDAKFVVRSAGTVRGAFLTSYGIGAASPAEVLYCTGVAPEPIDVAVNGTLAVVYHLTLTSE